MYFITCFSKVAKDDLGRIDMGASRTFGYYDNFDHADEALRQNCCDMHETIHYYAVVEKIDVGIHPIAEKRWFYKYDEEKGGFYPIEEPKEFEHYMNIALG